MRPRHLFTAVVVVTVGLAGPREPLSAQPSGARRLPSGPAASPPLDPVPSEATGPVWDNQPPAPAPAPPAASWTPVGASATPPRTVPAPAQPPPSTVAPSGPPPAVPDDNVPPGSAPGNAGTTQAVTVAAAAPPLAPTPVPAADTPTPAAAAAPAEPHAHEPPATGTTGGPAVSAGTSAPAPVSEGSASPAGAGTPADGPTAGGPLGPQTPIVYVEKIGPASINKSKTLSYTIVVRNPGPVAVSDVRVEDETPAGARVLRADPAPDDHGRMLSWRLGVLPPGAERRLQVDCQLSSEGEILSRATVTFSVASVLKTKVTQPSLSITKTGPETIQIGDPAVFQITVSNSGTGPATNVVLHDKLPPGLKHPQGRDIEADLGTVEAGQTRTLTLSATAVSPGRQVNEAVATADDGLRAAAQATVLVTEPLLVLRATGPQRRYLNRTAEFDLEVGNPGTAAATNVRVTDVLPPGLDFEAASDNGAYDPAGRTVTWNLATLAARQTQHLSVRTTAKAVGDLVNHAEAVADRGLAAKADVAVHVEGIAALMLEMVDLDDPLEVGGETSYEIRIVNQGTAPSTGLQIVATVPAEMAVRGASGPTPYRIQGQQVIFEPMARLAAHADTVYRVKVLAQKPGDLRFQVQMNADQLKAPVVEQEATRVYSD